MSIKITILHECDASVECESYTLCPRHATLAVLDLPRWKLDIVDGENCELCETHNQPKGQA